MTYFVRAAFLSFSTFFLTYVLLSLVLVCGWRGIRKRGVEWSASLLFGLRVFPLVCAVALVTCLVLPSFLYLEPHQPGESFAIHALALGFGGLVLIGFGAVSALFAAWKTSRYVASCCRTGPIQRNEFGTATIKVAAASPLLLVAGVCKPTLLVSEQTHEILNPDELQVAIRHEMAHVRVRDNLKKLVLRFCRFPWLESLERSWMRRAELEADEIAVTNESAAVDLASALVKLASQLPHAQVPEIAMSLVRDSDDALRARVERLLTWKPRAIALPRKRLSMTLALSGVAVFVAVYAPMLHHVHELTELLMR